ncbi:MAG: PAS domain S-box protein [Promethearchaeota archaeon]
MVLIESDVLKEFIERAQIGFALSDIKGKIVYINRAIAKIFKIKNIDKVIGQEIYNYNPSFKEEKFREEVINNIKRNGFWIGELLIRRETGELLETLQNIFIIRDKKGRAKYFGNILMDISEQKKKEKILRESEEKFRSLTEQSIMAIFIFQDERIKYVNKAAEQITEYSVEEMLSWPPKEYYKMIYKDDLEIVKEQSRKKQEGMKEDIIPHYSFRIVTKSNKIKWGEIFSGTIFYKGKSADLVNMIDITTQYMAESKILQSEIRFQNIFNNMLNGYGYFKLIRDVHGQPIDFQCMDVNPAFTEILGIFKENIIGLNIVSLMKKADINILDILTPFFGVAEYRIPLVKEIYIKPLAKWLYINAFSPKPEFLIAIFNDITETKNAYKTIESEKATLSAILSSIQDGVIFTDSKGNIIIINNSAKEVLDIEQISSIEINKKLNINELLVLLNAEDNSLISNPYSEIIENSRKIIPKTYILTTRKNKEKLIEINATVLKGNDNGDNIQRGTVFVIRDITKKKELEDLIIRNKQIESIGLMAAGVAHDFNNLLTSILGNISLLKFDIENQTFSGDTIDLLRDAENATLQARELVKRLLTFSKGGETLSKKVHDIESIIRSTTDLIKVGKKVEINFYFDNNLWSVEIDESQIRQVIQNIVLNAIQAINEHGIIKISVRNIILEDNNLLLLKPGRYIEIKISDNGIGITKEQIPKIFDLYFSTKKNGSGLGLPISHLIIKKHGGTITVDSKVGEGTTFKIYLPATEKAFQKKVLMDKREKVKKIEKEIQKESPMFKGEPILILEDDLNVARSLKIMLRRLNFSSDIANTAEKAIDMYKRRFLEKKPYSLIFIDLNLTGDIDGVKAFREILKIDPNAKGIISTSYSAEELLNNFQDYGFIGRLTKPYTLSELVVILKSVFKSKNSNN